MRRTVNIVFILIFVLMLLLPLLLTKTEEGVVSDADGRTLLAKPAFGSENYNSGMEAWLRDRLGLRDEIVSAHEVSNDLLFDELINPAYQYGKDGHLFFKIHDNIDYSSYHRQFAEMVAEMQQYCESRGTRFYYVFNPEKESLYREYLPDGVNYSDEWADSMIEYMKHRGVNCIDLRKSLTGLDSDECAFNKKYDAGHWNHTGSFYGMKALTERIQNDIPDVNVLKKEEYDITTTTVEKIYGSSQSFNEETPQYKLIAGYDDFTGDFESELERSDTYPHFGMIRNDSKDAKGIERLLLFEDDLYEPFAYARSKETIAVTCLHNAVNFDYFYNIFKPDAVIFENMEYVVKDQYFSQSEMEAASRNPAVMKNYPEDDFAERKEALLEQTEEAESDAAAVLIPGKAIDRVFISSNSLKAKYSYLITDSRVIDLKKNENGALCASIRHGDLSGPDVVLFTQKKSGLRRYAVIPVTNVMRNIAVVKDSTDNASYDKNNNTYNMTDPLNGDAFTYTAVQLFNEDITEYLAGIGSSDSTGTVDGGYCHKLPTGDYTLLLKSGSKKANEWITFKVHLVKGRSYWFSYNVDEFTGNNVSINGFGFFESAGE